MVWLFISQKEDGYKLLRDNVGRFRDVFQYVYSVVYPNIYCSNERRGFDLKSSFQFVFKACKDKKKAERGNDLSNFKDKNGELKFEQKPMEIDTFDEIEEEKTKEKIEKRKKKRRELVEKTKALKRKKRRAQYEIEETQF